MTKLLKQRYDEGEFVNVALRTDFATFVHHCVLTLQPGRPFQKNWHLDAIAYALEQVRKGKIRRLIINLPPRYLKSVMASVAFPMFVLGHDPTRKIFCISYGTELAAKHAADSRTIFETPRFHQAFPNLKIKRSADSNLYTSRGGFRIATSVNATLTGLGGDIFIIDDPIKALDAQSEPQRNNVNTWFSNTLLPRLDDKKTGAIIVVMQRVHNDDLTGYLLERFGDEWTVLSLPAIAEADEKIPIGDGKFYERKAGGALHPERESEEVLKQVRREVGPDVWAAQYQQMPSPPGGTMIKRAWLRYYDSTPATRGKILQSWDTAAKGGANNAFSACTTWLVANQHWYLLDAMRGASSIQDFARRSLNSQIGLNRTSS